MVIQADGEKYACDACVRGHRVSSCTHKDRHLNHINKKGRPVSQCPHCRSLRKNRASHVKCVCAEVGLTRTEAGACKENAACHCGQGQPCICAAKREAYAIDHFSKVAPLNTTQHRRTQSKPNIANRRSDNIVPKYQNGHHPPLHRFNHAAHDYSPYPVKRSHTTTGPINITQPSTDILSSATHPASSGIYSTSPSSLPMTSYMSHAGALGSGNILASASVPSGLNTFAGPDTFVGDGQEFVSGTRWSMTDFSSLSNYAGFGNEQYNNQDPLSAMSDQQFSWADWDFNAATTTEGTQPAGSVASVDHPGLSRSSSGTASDTGESSFNPADVNFSRMPMPSMANSEAAWRLDDSWPSDGRGMQDKTPLAMPSQSTGSGAGVELNDYFGDFCQNGAPFASSLGQLDDVVSYSSAPASAYTGPTTGMAMSTMSEQAAPQWSTDEQMSQRKADTHAQGPPYHGQGWL